MQLMIGRSGPTPSLHSHPLDPGEQLTESRRLRDGTQAVSDARACWRWPQKSHGWRQLDLRVGRDMQGVGGLAARISEPTKALLDHRHEQLLVERQPVVAQRIRGVLHKRVDRRSRRLTGSPFGWFCRLLHRRRSAPVQRSAYGRTPVSERGATVGSPCSCRPGGRPGTFRGGAAVASAV